MQPFLHVTQAEQLSSALTALASSEIIALDTEFMRESTYFPKLCLLQAATRDVCVVFDPLTLPNLAPIMMFLRERHRIKVLHAARQDLEVLSLHSAELPGPIFDTQIAAGLLGLPAQIGYADLVQRQLGRSLEKGHTRTDWSARPLSTDQLEYAADDVRYLVPLYQNLAAELEQRNRLKWLAQEGQELEDVALYRTDPDEAWQRLKGFDRLDSVQRCAAKLLSAWRERAAIDADKPRGWILSDEVLRILIERLPASSDDIHAISARNLGVLRKRSAEILELLQLARAQPALQISSQFRPTTQQLGRVTQLMNAVRETAQRENMSPEILATRRDIEQWVFSGKSPRLQRGWRAEVLNHVLQ